MPLVIAAAPSPLYLDRWNSFNAVSGGIKGIRDAVDHYAAGRHCSSSLLHLFALRLPRRWAIALSLLRFQDLLPIPIRVFKTPFPSVHVAYAQCDPVRALCESGIHSRPLRSGWISLSTQLEYHTYQKHSGVRCKEDDHPEAR